MATVEEVLIHFQGVDNVSPTVQQMAACRAVFGTWGFF